MRISRPGTHILNISYSSSAIIRLETGIFKVSISVTGDQQKTKNKLSTLEKEY